jgi:anaerobic magnesium-protoporphyrin IX monomethyl ester cyclase
LDRLDFDQCLEQLNAYQPQIIGYTAFTNEIKPCAYLAAKVKMLLPQALNVIGGVHVSAIPERTMEEFPMFDVGVIGEGEETLLEIVRQVGSGNTIDGVSGTISRQPNGTLNIGPVRPRILDQNSLPIPAWDLMRPSKTYYIQTLRGCPLNCVFCMNPNGRVARKRSVDLVIEELEYLIETFNPELISFGDELFSVDLERTLELLYAMIAAKIGERVKWDVQTHVRFVNDDMFRKFKQANVTRVEMGIETGDEEALKRMGKGTNLQMINEAFQLAKKHDVPFGTFFLLGQPNETVKSIISTIKLAVKMNPQLPMFGLMTPYPGTAVANMAAKGEAGYRLLSTDWDDYNKQIGGALEFQNISRWQLEWLQSFAYVAVYLFNFRFVDLLKFVYEYRVGVYHVILNLFGLKRASSKANRPSDYEALTSRNGTVTNGDMVASYEHWSNYQKQSMVDVKKRRAETNPVL